MISLIKIIEEIKKEYFPVLDTYVTFDEDGVQNIIYYKYVDGDYKILHCVGPIANATTLIQESRLYKELSEKASYVKHWTSFYYVLI